MNKEKLQLCEQWADCNYRLMQLLDNIKFYHNRENRFFIEDLYEEADRLAGIQLSLEEKLSTVDKVLE